MSERDRDLRRDQRRLERIAPRLEQRARIMTAIRGHFTAAGFLEVETPVRIEAPAPEAHIDAEPSGDRFLITSPELQMKRLLAAGYGCLFQFCRCFRQGERGTLHLPEFTMIEWYRTGAGMEELMIDCGELLRVAGQTVDAYPAVRRDDKIVDLATPWERLELRDAFESHAGWRPGPDPDQERFDRDLVDKVEPALPVDRPVFLVGYPAAMASLACLDPGDPTRAERFELYAGGMELANGFAELTDAGQQRRRFETEIAARQKVGRGVCPVDERFLGALELGLAPCAGIALGFDRLVMLLTGADTIDDVVAFPEGTA